MRVTPRRPLTAGIDVARVIAAASPTCAPGFRGSGTKTKGRCVGGGYAVEGADARSRRSA